MATRLTRAQLYAMVWDRPMTRLAKEFALSDVALHKICRKHAIPTPPQGYWAKKAHGKPVTTTALPTGQLSAEAVVVIYEGAGSAESEAMAEARACALLQVREGARTAPAPSPLIERTLAKLEKTKADRAGLAHTGKGFIRAAIRPASLERARSLLTRLNGAAAAAGIDLKIAGEHAVWAVNGETIAFELVELPDRYAHEPTDQELRALAAWEAKRADTHRRFGYMSDYGRPHIPKWEDRYQGRLGIRLEDVRVRTEEAWWGSVISRSFGDTKTRDVLDAVPKIVATIAAIAVAKRENRELEARRSAAAEAAERARAERERLAAIERKRCDALAQLMSTAEELQRLERHRAGLPRVEDCEGFPALAGFHAWLSERIARLRAEVSRETLDQRLDKTGLFAPPG